MTCAHGLGVPVAFIRWYYIGLGVLLAAVATAATGPIAFVAFVAGPIARRIIGGRHTILGASLVGATIVVLADFVAANLFPDHLFPVGILRPVLWARRCSSVARAESEGRKIMKEITERTLKVENVSLGCSESTIVKDLSLEFPGKITAIIGPQLGCGKSTPARGVSRLLKAAQRRLHPRQQTHPRILHEGFARMVGLMLPSIAPKNYRSRPGLPRPLPLPRSLFKRQ